MECLHYLSNVSYVCWYRCFHNLHQSMLFCLMSRYDAVCFWCYWGFELQSQWFELYPFSLPIFREEGALPSIPVLSCLAYCWSCGFCWWDWENWQRYSYEVLLLGFQTFETLVSLWIIHSWLLSCLCFLPIFYRCCNEDGLILKPTVPATSINAVFLEVKITVVLNFWYAAWL